VEREDLQQWLEETGFRHGRCDRRRRRATLGEIGVASTEDVSAAAAAARKAQKEWAELPGPKRGDVLREFSRLVLARSEEIWEKVAAEGPSDARRRASSSNRGPELYSASAT
jgi:acyl-CoA reductase-like NAD-dependent aldehyde dehydrogenase